MGSQLFLIVLLLVTCTEQIQGNSKTDDTSLKLSKDESALGKPVIHKDLDTIRKLPSSLCKCEGNVRYYEKKPCLCVKPARHNNRRAKLRKLCQRGQVKNPKKCRFPKKNQRKYISSVPM